MGRHIKTPTPLALASLGLLGLIPTLAGCATAAESTSSEPAENSTVETAPSAPAPYDPDAPTAASSAVYADGTYTAKGGYQSPGGPETIELTITLANNVISQVIVTPGATGGTSSRYQGQFAEGVGAETVGKALDDIKVSRISGSSLTSGGFNEALDSIKADAKG